MCIRDRSKTVRGWAVEVLDSQETDLGGFKSITLAVKARGTDPDDFPLSLIHI